MKNVIYRFCLILALFQILTVGRTSAQIFIVSNQAPVNVDTGDFSVLAYNFDGSFKNTIPLSLTNAPITIVTDGTNLFGAYLELGVVGEYAIAGGIVNPSLISGLNNPEAMALSGTNLYVADNGRIGEYTTSGGVINSNLITGITGQPTFGMVVLGTNIYEAVGATIQKFSTDGTVANASFILIPGYVSTAALATDGTNLFISLENGSIAVYSTSGAAISPILINGLASGYNPIAIVGTNLYIYQPDAQTISQYTTSGALINSALVSTSTHTIWGFTAVSSAVSAPPPTTQTGTYSNQPVVFWPASGNYTLQMTTNSDSTNWITVSNYAPVTGTIVTNAPSAFFGTLGASAQIFILDYAQNPPSIDGYSFDGIYKNSATLLGNGSPQSIATDGTNLFVVDGTLGVVGEYTTSGVVVNPSLISGLTYPFALSVSGTNIYVSDMPGSGARIGKYSTSGLPINTNLITINAGGYFITGIAVMGTNLYAAVYSGAIGQFTTDGLIVNSSLIVKTSFTNGLAALEALQTDGTNLFSGYVDTNYQGNISEFSPNGTSISPTLIPDVGVVRFMSICGTNLFCYNNGYVEQYTTSGTLVNPSLIHLANNNYSGLVALPPPPPPPSSGIATYSNQPVVFWPAGGSYTLQMTTNLSSTNWVAFTNYVPVTGAIVTNVPPAAVFRLQPAD